MIRIVHLYPQEMNIYGDQGNVIAIERRCQWRGIEVSIKHVGILDKVEFKPGDILFMGGGQDKGQERVAADLRQRESAIKQAIEAGMPALLICGGYQLFGNLFEDLSGKTLIGIGVFDARTIAQEKRMIGNIVVNSKRFGKLVGFENHSGETYLADKALELGVVVNGYGNNQQGSGEGAISHNAIGTYMHGSFLPKNPQVADWLIVKALKNLGQYHALEPLNDEIEKKAAEFAAQLPQ